MREDLCEMAARHVRLGDAVALGAWHSHPNWDDRPSQPDLRVITENMREFDISRWVEVIVNRSADGAGWLSPRLSAWVTRRDRGVCERADIINGGW
jgi:proteasome lid subunit RPN8/RPN11